MKKFTKITLILSVMCLVLGMSLIIGTGVFGDLYYSKIDLDSEPNGVSMRDIRLVGNDIRELDITVTAAALEVVIDDTIDEITVQGGSGLLDVNHSVEKDTLHLEIKAKDQYKVLGDFGDEALILRIPAALWLQELDINLNAAELNAERLAAEEISLNLNAARAEIYDVESGALDVENHASSFWMYGAVAREIEVDCNAGNVEMELNNAYTEFNYEVDCKVGKIHIGDREYSGLKSAVTLQNDNAKKYMDLDCNAGEIAVWFTEKGE